MQTVFCLCGCGQLIESPGKRFILGHHRRLATGTTLTERSCKKCGKIFFPHYASNLYCSTNCSNSTFRKHYKSSDKRKWKMVVEDDNGCWITPGKGTGYRQTTNNGQKVYVHHLAWGENIPNGFQVNHVCDNRSCIRNDDVGIYEVSGKQFPRKGHLWLGTQADNIADMVAKGRHWHSKAK